MRWWHCGRERALADGGVEGAVSRGSIERALDVLGEWTVSWGL